MAASPVNSDHSLPKHRPPAFATTHWSTVRAAGVQNTDGRSALESLCQTYWYPLYAFARRSGQSPSDAQDLTQGFFADLLERHTIARADAEQGRFRSFLLGSFKLFMSEQRRLAATLKRGGGQHVISFDTADAEARYQWEPADQSTPESMYERRWALAVLDASLQQLSRQYTSEDKPDLFHALQGHLGADKSVEPHSEVANRLGMSEAAVKVAAHRMRKRYRQTLRLQIAQTLSNSDDLEDELQRLLRALG